MEKSRMELIRYIIGYDAESSNLYLVKGLDLLAQIKMLDRVRYVIFL